MKLVNTLYRAPYYDCIVIELGIKDGVLSAFEHHCAKCYNLPFTGFILIPIGANLLRNYY
jgi:hypothetical protein